MGNSSSTSSQQQQEQKNQEISTSTQQSESSETKTSNIKESEYQTSTEISGESSTKIKSDTQEEFEIQSEDQKLNLQQSKKFDLNKFRTECLQAHNEKRKLHRVSDLKRNSALDEIAQNYAEKLAQANSLNHSSNSFDGKRLGENLYMQGGRAMSGFLPVDSWYGEAYNYKYDNPRNSSGVVGHFTQLVWKGSNELGVGCAKARDGSFYVVCNYSPAGNWVGEERENVFPR
jgi:uncharacterized protein YkwD